MGRQQSIMIVSLVLRRIMVVPVLLSMLISLGSAAPIHFAPFPSPSVNVATATANVTVVGSSLRPIGEYLTTLFPPVRRCGGRRGSKCGGSSSRPPPPPPPGPTQIAQSLLLKNVNTSEYAGLYKVVVEAGWGISIGIYDEANRDWRLGVTATSSASNSCDGNWCGMEVRFRATVPWNLHHRAESLSASAFCSGVAAAKKAMAKGSTIRVPNQTDVTVLTTDVDPHEGGVDWVAVGIGIGFGVLLLVFLGVVLGAACGKA